MDTGPTTIPKIEYERPISDDTPPTPAPFQTINIDSEVVIPDSSILNPFPLYIQFTQIFYKVKQRIILDLKTQFEIGPGEILAIIGSSGAGKSSLLNVLAGRYPRYQGDVTYNGVKLTKSIKRIIGYVTQDDILLKNLTVEESLLFTALLRLSDQPRKRVEEKLIELGINHCKKQRIGSHGEKNVISGGERKRTSVAVELLTNPSVIFLDEPTSGLDSKTALNLMDTLVDLAKFHRTVVLTIHQPRSDIFNRFDKLMILSKGKIIYFGARDNALQYFATFGCLCPSYFNPGDFLIDQISESDDKTDRLLAAYEKCEKPPLISRISDVHASAPYSAGYLYQVWILFRRSFLCFIRDKSVCLARILQAIAMALLVGLIYLGGVTGQRAIQNLTGALFFIMIQQGMSPLFTTLTVFQSEKNVLYKEYESKQYSISAYFIGKSLAEVPMYMIAPAIFGTIVYFMVGFQATAAKFFIFLLIIVLTALSSNSLGLIILTIHHDNVDSILWFLPECSNDPGLLYVDFLYFVFSIRF
jgi:ABC-type multidrug transport system ATPase subunit